MRELQAARGTALTRRRFGAVQGLALGVGLVGLGIDQLSKLAALTSLEPGRSVDLLGEVLKLTLIRNPGAAFGMGGGFTVGFSIFAILALLACLVFALPRMRRVSHGIALGLLMAGIAGNLWDRIFLEPGVLRGHVIDFIHVPFFAIFNVADICITLAAVWIVWLSFTSDAQRATRTDQVYIQDRPELDADSAAEESNSDPEILEDGEPVGERTRERDA